MEGTMKEQKAMDVMQKLWEIVRDNKCTMEELYEDFSLRRRPCCAIRRMARKAMERVETAHHRFVQIVQKYGFGEEYSLIIRTDKLYCKSVEYAAFFGI